MKIKKNDTVKIIAGKDKGKTGTVLKVIPEKTRLVVEGVAIAKRHTKGTDGQVGRIVERPMSIHASNVMILDPDTKKPTRIRIEEKDGKRVRVAVKSGKTIS